MFANATGPYNHAVTSPVSPCPVQIFRSDNRLSISSLYLSRLTFRRLQKQPYNSYSTDIRVFPFPTTRPFLRCSIGHFNEGFKFMSLLIRHCSILLLKTENANGNIFAYYSQRSPECVITVC